MRPAEGGATTKKEGRRQQEEEEEEETTGWKRDRNKVEDRRKGGEPRRV